MAVQQNRKTRSKRDMRRSHSSIKVPILSIDKTTKKTHIRHHMTTEGFYKGKKIL
ncbi:50S ribosomal protein L32 [Candidatus Riesia pediculischaeffi]|uniref:Large ribosomal subunit protein bL32 n=2 Tax=Candidatus Riesia pediculischaeffi TaxID=428411 RepID=A0A1V0HK99_9ENTR|nr:50S ribosomal protein L32 [Candidatus Riesia pediculischaeffi]ARC53254.1 50S ribosomal protein L32 [Candidatus Riesia pediculischaeffi]KIE64089.1 LSU ribosomal protein L32p [Candidatus Riesia pediculischaeffi PTSU]